MKIVRYVLIGLIPFVLSGCIFTKYETIEKPIYIQQPQPELEVYYINSSFEFQGLVKGTVVEGKYINKKAIADGVYILVPEKQFKDYVNLKIDLETELNKANTQVELYNKSRVKDRGEKDEQ